MKITLLLLFFSGWMTVQSLADFPSAECSSLCGERHGECLATCMSSTSHLERRHGVRRRGGRQFSSRRGGFQLNPRRPGFQFRPRRGGPPPRPRRGGGAQFGSRRGADVKNNAAARVQDQQDSMANAKADAGARQAATGGVGGVDAATGEILFALPPPAEFCKGAKQKFADGTQIATGFCNSIPQGQIPSTDDMVSTLIIEPSNGCNVALGAAFNVRLQTINLQTGFFTLAATEYYTQPQTLNAQGQIKGHQHITIQRLTSLTNAPNANVKQFFKGVNNAAGADGISVIPVPAGTLTTPGIYRICSISASFSHQPLIMPIAQRGAQDDCIRINVRKPVRKVGAKGGKRKGGKFKTNRKSTRRRSVKRDGERCQDKNKNKHM